MVLATSLTNAREAAVLRAEDYDRAKRFYQEKLGLPVTDSPGPTRGGMVKTGAATMFMIYERPGMSAPENTTLAFDVPDVEATVAELRARGVEFEDYDIPEIGLKTVDGVARHDGQMEAWFKDSEGNTIVISHM